MMPLTFDFVPSAPILRTSITSGSNSWICTSWSDSTDSNLTQGTTQQGGVRPLFNVLNNPTATANLEVLDNVQPTPLLNCVYQYSPHGSGSTAWGGSWVLTALTLNMQTNGVSNWNANFIYSGSYAGR